MKTKSIAFLGPLGTNTEQATIKYDSKATPINCSSINEIFEMVTTKKADEGMVPIENSIDGPVTDTLDILIHESKLSIQNEIILNISHCLITNKNSSEKESFSEIFSHPQALNQCKKFLLAKYPKTKLIASMSTSEAVKFVANSTKKNIAAIGTDRAAEIYEAQIIAKNIEDNMNNSTRFIVLSHKKTSPSGNDKTSLCFSFSKDSPGSLYKVLGKFAKRDINLTKIESRPSKNTLGQYVFLIDLEGHQEENLIKETLLEVKQEVSELKLFGSYPIDKISK